MPRVLSVQTRLLGNATYGSLLRRLFSERQDVAFRAVWGDEERLLREKTTLGRLVYRACFTFAAAPAVRARNADLYAGRYEIGTSYWARRVVARELRRERADVVHFHTQALALLAPDLMRRVPTVISADMTSRRTAEQFTAPRWRFTHATQHALEGIALRGAAALAPFSHYAARSMIAQYGVRPERVQVIGPGVDLAQFTGVGEARAARASDAPRRILFVGGEFERKGGAHLVRVFLERYAARDDVELHLVTGRDATVPKHPRIVVHHDVTAYSPAWRALYDRATVLVLPTRAEAYGLVYLEAAAARLPVIAAAVGAGPELVADGETGFLLDPYDASALAQRLDRLLDDPGLGLRMGAAARARAERDFDARRCTARLADLFTRVATRER